MVMNERFLVRLATLGALFTAAPMVVSATGDLPPVVITSDTPEYCEKLFDRISEVLRTTAEPAPVMVASLSTEGHQLCTEGLTRPGILRLRRALMLLRQEPPTP